MGDLNDRIGIVAEYVQGVSNSVEIDAFADLFSTDEHFSTRVSNDTKVNTVGKDFIVMQLYTTYCQWLS
jgi:hypothetical protein